MRRGTVDANATYLHRDQVGSVVMSTLASFTVQQRQYFPYGKKRGGDDFTFEADYTGQRRDDTGLMYYNARYYDPQLGMFISPDTLIPDPTDYFSYNRFLYGRGNPLKFNDPSGHVPCNDAACYNAHGLYQDAQGGWTVHGEADFTNASPELITAMMNEAGIAFANGRLGTWFPHEVTPVLQGIVALANKISNFNNETGLIHLKQLLGGQLTQLVREGGANFEGAAAWVGLGQVLQSPALGELNRMVHFHDDFFSSPDYIRGATVHELAHVMDFNANPFMDLSSNIPIDAAFPIGPGAHDGRSYEWFAEITAQWTYAGAGPNPYRAAWGIASNVPIPQPARQFLADQLGLP